MLGRRELELKQYNYIMFKREIFFEQKLHPTSNSEPNKRRGLCIKLTCICKITQLTQFREQ